MKTLVWIACLLGITSPTSASDWRSSEKLAAKAEQEVLKPWRQAWRDRDPDGFARLFDKAAQVPSWKHDKTARRERDGISEFDWTQARSAVKDESRLRKDAAAYLAGFSAVEHVEIQLLDVIPAVDGDLVLKARLDLRGLQADGTRRTDRGPLEVTVKRAPEGLRIAKIAAAGLETLTARRPVFEDVTAAAGLDGVPVLARQEAIRRGGYALAVGDLHGSGFADILVGGSGPCQLFRNADGKRYVDVTARAGLAGITRVKAALLADLDNDGRPDIVLQRFVDDQKGELLFYRNKGDGAFEKVEARIARLRRHDRPMSMAAADFNGDGKLDLYVGYPGIRDFTDGWIETGKAAAHQAIYLNEGGWRFKEAGDAQTPLLAEPVRPHSEVAMDVDGDGRQDLVVVDDSGGPARTYLNRGDSGFAESAPLAALSRGWGMSAAAGDYLGLGKPAIYFTNIDFTPGRRLIALASRDRDAAPGLDRLRALQEGNRLYMPSGVGSGSLSLAETTAKAGVGYAGEAPAGAAWIDYNNDGLLDLYVTNGLWSADPERDASSEFVQGVLDAKGARPDKPGAANAFMKRLQENGASFAGYQRNRLFRNNGDGSLTEVGYLTGADRIEDGYVAALLDYDHDGRVDLVLRNADPADLRHAFRPLVMLRNRGVDGRKSLAVTLQGADGDTAKYAARVTVECGGRRQTREIHSVEGATQSEAVAYFGLGKAERADVLEVTWPSGTIDRFTDVPAGRVLVREGDERLAAAR